ncbi:uncharacterized protein LOC144366051 [Ictidomys tridecemlineatus]
MLLFSLTTPEATSAASELWTDKDASFPEQWNFWTGYAEVSPRGQEVRDRTWDTGVRSPSVALRPVGSGRSRGKDVDRKRLNPGKNCSQGVQEGAGSTQRTRSVGVKLRLKHKTPSLLASVSFVRSLQRCLQ